MTNIDKRIEELVEQYDELEKEYINYLEADMNKEARKTHNKMEKINEKIGNLEEQRDYGLKEDMKKTINLYKRFISIKGLSYEFDNFVEKEEEEICF